MLLKDFRDEFISFLSANDLPAELIREPDLHLDLVKCGEDIFFHLNLLAQNAGINNEENTIALERKGINLIQIWEDQWNTHRDILTARILALCGKAKRIYARETEIAKLTNPELTDFLRQNHLSVPIKGKIKLGLKHNGELVSVISFSHPRTFGREAKVKSYEILRYCNLKEHVVVGGLSKLLKSFIKAHHPDHIMTYIDREWGSGAGFKKVGFKSVGHLEKRAFLVHINDHNRIQLTQKSRLSDHDKIVFFKVYNAGSIKMEQSLISINRSTQENSR